MIREAVIILAAASLATLISAFFHPKRPAWHRVEDPSDIQWSLTVEQAKKLIRSGEPVLWIDARSRREFEKGHLADAILLNTDEWGDLMYQHQNRLQKAMGHPIIVYCDGSGCQKSKEIAERLRELLGLDPVFVLKGKWRKLGAVAVK